MTVAQRAIAVTTDPASMLTALAKTFTNAETCLWELVQNANRANATCVSIDYDAATQTLTVTDDGEGIADFEALLALALSGWSEEVREANSAFGLGFTSAFFAGHHLTVESRSTRLSTPTEAIRNIQMIPLETIEPRVGTKIVIEGFVPRNGDLFGLAKQQLKGFPIPVWFNGAAIPRPDAASDEEGWFDTEIGRMRVHAPLAGPENTLAFPASATLYLQGFRIGTSGKWNCWETVGCVHLDPRQFHGRLPDRAQLIDETACVRRVDAAFATVVQQVLAAEKARVSPERFARAYADACVTWGCPQLLRDIPCLPGAWFGTFEEPPALRKDYGDEAGFSVLKEGIVHLDALPNLILGPSFGRIEDDGEDGSLERAVYAYASNATVMHRNVSTLREIGHPLAARVLNDDEPPIVTVSPTAVLATRKVDLGDFWGTLALVEAIHLDGPLGRVALPTTFGIPLTTEGDGPTLYVMEATTSDVTCLVNTFMVDDAYDVDFDNEVRDTFSREHALLTGASPDKVLAMVLDEVSGRIPDEARGKRFAVTIDEHGKVAVEEIAS
jgi:hypothetical protein